VLAGFGVVLQTNNPGTFLTVGIYHLNTIAECRDVHWTSISNIFRYMVQLHSRLHCSFVCTLILTTSVKMFC